MLLRGGARGIWVCFEKEESIKAVEAALCWGIVAQEDAMTRSRNRKLWRAQVKLYFLRAQRIHSVAVWLMFTCRDSWE